MRVGDTVFVLPLEQRDQPLDDFLECLVRLDAHSRVPGTVGCQSEIDASTINENASAGERVRAWFGESFFALHQNTTAGGHIFSDAIDATTRSRNGTCSPLRTRELNVRVVTIKHPPPALEGTASDNLMIGKLYDLPAQLAILMIAAGWVRSDTRSKVRRHRDQPRNFNRREQVDRRSTAAA